MGQIKPMIYRNLFQSNLMHFAKLCKEHAMPVIERKRKEQKYKEDNNE